MVLVTVGITVGFNTAVAVVGTDVLVGKVWSVAVVIVSVEFVSSGSGFVDDAVVTVARPDVPDEENWCVWLVLIVVGIASVGIKFGNDSVVAFFGTGVAAERDWSDGLIGAVVPVSSEICVGINNVVAVMILDKLKEEDW